VGQVRVGTAGPEVNATGLVLLPARIVT